MKFLEKELLDALNEFKINVSNISYLIESVYVNWL